MKFPISISSKKYIGKMSTEKTKKMNGLESPVEREKPPTIEESLTSQQENNTLSGVISEHPSLNIRAKSQTQNLPSSDNSNNCGSLENMDVDNKFIGMFKRVSLDRSLSCDDSGFSSCTSDDRDEMSERLSFDLAFLSGDEDDNAKILKQIPIRLRQRSYSLDSESSDYSDSHFPNTKTWSSGTYLDLSKNLVLWRDSNNKLFNDDNSLRLRDTLVKSSSVEKVESVNNVTEKLNPSIPLIRPAIQRRRRAVKDHNNNSQRGSVIKNLKSYQKCASPSMNNCFKDHGLLTLISCIFYTLFLGFIIGICGLLFQVIKICEYPFTLSNWLQTTFSAHSCNQWNLLLWGNEICARIFFSSSEY